MKLLIATGLFPPQVGGPATYSKLLLEQLPQRGFDVSVVSFSHVLKYPVVVRHLVYFFKLIYKAVRADAVFALDPVSVGLPAFAASKLLGKQFYVKIVGDYAWEQGTQRFGVTELLDEFSQKETGYVWQVRMMKWVQKSVASGADKVLVPSDYLKRIVSNWGVQPEKIKVIYNAFSHTHLLRSQDELRREFGWQGTVVISVGRLVPWKGFGTLIEIWPEVLEQVPDTTLLIAGDGPEKTRLEQVLETSTARDKVKLLGRVQQQELFEKMKAADLFVLNTSYEGLSHLLLECLSLETPVVTTDVGGNPEVIVHEESGLLVPYDDRAALVAAIVAVLRDKEKAIKFVMNGKNRLTRFSEDRMLDNLETFLRA